VGFRLYVEDAARRDGLAGYVRNRDDGAVEILAEGERDGLERFERAVRRGPAGARVDEVTTTEAPVSGEFFGFSVRG
jgi:acylphosphatase